jgi:antirestriction protein ArdC
MAHALAGRSEPGSHHRIDDINRGALAQFECGKVPWLNTAWLALVCDIRCCITPIAPGDTDEVFHDLFAATGIDSSLGAARTFYNHVEDRIILADWRTGNRADFLCDWIHELVHATGHASRLARDLPLVFGSNAHGIEDLIVEIGAAIVCRSLGIEARLRHPDSLGIWTALLRSDDRIFGQTVRHARDAADYLFAQRDAQAAAFDRLEAEVAREEREGFQIPQ